MPVADAIDPGVTRHSPEQQAPGRPRPKPTLGELGLDVKPDKSGDVPLAAALPPHCRRPLGERSCGLEQEAANPANGSVDEGRCRTWIAITGKDWAPSRTKCGGNPRQWG